MGTGPDSNCSSTLTIHFDGVVGGQPFGCGFFYWGQGADNTSVTPGDFRFFVQDLALIRDDGTRVPVDVSERAPWQSKTVSLVDFEDQSGACASGNPETNTEITGTVPAGTYKGISFTTGVPEDLNHADPATLSDPLKTYKDLSWGAADKGFRFVTAELQQEPNAGSGGGLFQLSSSECTGDPVKCAKPNRNDVVLDNFDVCNDVVLADIGEIFAYADLTQATMCTPDGQSCDALYSSIGVNYDTGAPQEWQTVFRKR